MSTFKTVEVQLSVGQSAAPRRAGRINIETTHSWHNRLNRRKFFWKKNTRL